ncbi:MAG: SEL1-like repeat protein [Muribaculaceae bacterium]|nr:SEL1-like repeat protein [Muribaculaceae bacterium]
MKDTKRLLAVDILRGITIAGMLLVNNPGSWGSIYAPLEHAEWIGLTPTDLVFPFFVFVMGVSMFFSLRKFDFKPSRPLLWKIVRRTLVLFLIGWAISLFGMTLRSFFGSTFDMGRWWNHLRFLGVFQRLALVYFFGSMIAIFFKQKFIPWLIGLLLVGYAVLLWWGNGYEFSTANILSRVDLAVLGDDHMYHESAYGLRLSLDPEGVLSTISCVAHVLIGFMVGSLLVKYRDNRERVMKVATLGIALLLIGWLLQYGIPCSKKAWTSSYTLITTGMASCILALLVYIIDIKGHDRWCRFFQSFGVNPLFCYLVGTILSIVFSVVILGHSSDYRAADEEKATELLTTAAKAELPEACNNLGIMTYNGEGVEPDTLKAQLLFEKAAQAGLNEARFNLAVVYLNEGDSARALPLLQEAADSALNVARFDLALAHDYGLMGLAQDHAQARRLYALAAGEGHSRSLMALHEGNGKEEGLTEVFSTPRDLFMTGLVSSSTKEVPDSVAPAKGTEEYNQALEVASSHGRSFTLHSLLHDGCKWATGAERNDDGSVKALNPEAASCLYAIAFVLIVWILGYILYRRRIYIKI